MHPCARPIAGGSAGILPTLRMLALLIPLICVLGSAAGQALPEAAAKSLARGQRLAAEALVTYPAHSPDQRLWEQALEAGREAARLAPDHPAPRRFLAQAYLQVGWYARSWSNWQAFLDRGGRLDATAQRQYLEVARWLGINAYDNGRYDEAIPYLRAVLDYAPDDLGANERLARLYLDRDDPLAALPHLEAVAGRVPGLEEALRRARAIDRYGRAAAAAYAEATSALATGSPTTALQRFLDATDERPDFADAWRGAAQAAERLGRLDDAERFHARVLDLAPDDPDAIAGLGRVAMAREDYDAAAMRFERAASLAPDRAAFAQAAERSRALRAAQVAEAEAQATAQADAAAQAAAEARAAEEAERAAAERAAADQAAAEQAAAERAAAEQEAAATEAAERADAEDAARRVAEEEAARAAEDAAAEAAARVQAEEEAEAAARAEAERATRTGADDALVLVDARADHRRSERAGAGAVAFLDAPALMTDLSGRTSESIHLEIDVLAKPGPDPVLYQLCLVPRDIAVRPACTDPTLLSLTSTGRYRAQQPWSSLAGFSGVDWSAGIDSVMLVMRRQDGAPVDAPSAAGERGLDAYLPMSVHVRAVAAPPNAF